MRAPASTPPPPANRSSGFTIIEVLIVLAIAGLIMLIVFLAIPTLARSSRNTQRKHDVATILEAVSRYELNNSANFPATAADLTPTPAVTFYAMTDVTFTSQGSVTPESARNHTAPADTTTVEVYNYLKCDPDNPDKGITQGTDYTNIAALYGVESGSGNTGLCQQL